MCMCVVNPAEMHWADDCTPLCLRLNGWILRLVLSSALSSCLVDQRWGSALSLPVRSRCRKWPWMEQKHTSPLFPCPRTWQSWHKELISVRDLTLRKMELTANQGTVSGPSRSRRKRKVMCAQERVYSLIRVMSSCLDPLGFIHHWCYYLDKGISAAWPSSKWMCQFNEKS